MKINKLLSAFFACAIMVGCASNETTDDTAAAERAAAEAAAAERAAAEAAAAERDAADRVASEAAANMQSVFYFDFDKATLTSESRAALDEQITFLKGNSSQIRLEGHADERGTREYNMALGERRANAVANYLIINGIERYRIETVSLGEERPVAMGSDESSWSQNRRVELK